jgi:hypothetical protein
MHPSACRPAVGNRKGWLLTFAANELEGHETNVSSSPVANPLDCLALCPAFELDRFSFGKQPGRRAFITRIGTRPVPEGLGDCAGERPDFLRWWRRFGFLWRWWSCCCLWWVGDTCVPHVYMCILMQPAVSIRGFQRKGWGK